MNKEETVRLETKMPLITTDDIRVLENNFSFIVNEVINTYCKAREMALLQLIIKKQQQALIDIMEYIYRNREEYSNYVGGKKDWLYIKDKDILQIIDKVLGDDEK